MIALVTDSNAQLPAELRERFGVRVVPLTVVVDGEDHLEGVDLDAAEFYERLTRGASVSTAAPSPGLFAEAYTEAVESGAEAILVRPHRFEHVGDRAVGDAGRAHVVGAGRDRRHGYGVVPDRLLCVGGRHRARTGR